MQVRIYRKLSRNSLCPCDSGKKIKKCGCEDSQKKDDIVDTRTREVFRNGEVVGQWEGNK